MLKKIILLIASSHFFIAINLFALSEKEALIKSENHWNHYYQSKEKISPPSSFALECLSVIPKHLALLELGCGDGRDALFFARQGIKVYACDLSEVTIHKLNQLNQNKNINFFVADFSNLPSKPSDIKITRCANFPSENCTCKFNMQ